MNSGHSKTLANPLMMILFVEMCLKAWIRYSCNYFEKKHELEIKGQAF